MAPTVAGYVGSPAFELDGNIDHSGANHDWDQAYQDNLNGNTALSGADSVPTFVTDKVNTTADDIFTGGGSKDQQLIQTGPWLWTTSKPQPKDDITHAFAAAYTINGHIIAYFGLDKYEVDGDNQVGFWFFKNQIGKTNISQQGGFKFSGEHAVGDILVLADYTNGGTVPNFKVYQWVGSGGSNGSLDLVASGGLCSSSNQFACGITNSSAFTSDAWPYKNRDENAQTWPIGGLFEGGLDLTHFGLDTGCFTSFLAETRSSQSVDSTLSDFALGNFSFCEAPDLETQVSSSSGSVGDSFTDTATLSGNKGPVNGTVDFFVCGPTQAEQECTSGGASSGAGVPVVNGEATSDSVLASAAGFYCFRTEFTPEDGSKYLPTTHTATEHECFEAKPAAIHVTKSADADSVSAGSDIGFTVTVSNTGAGNATGVTLSDALPGGNGGSPVHWTIDGATGDPASFAISGADGSQQLTLAGQPITLNAGDSLTVHIVAATSAANCAVYDNTASVSTTNDGADEASDTTAVLCPDLDATKTADNDPVSAGEQIGFTIEIMNNGLGDATNVELHDPLPAGADVDWSIADQPAGNPCSISGSVGAETLDCSFGTLLSGTGVSVHVVSDTTPADCTTLPNVAHVTASNNPSLDPADDVTVECPGLNIAKTAAVSPIHGGDTASFTVSVWNVGPGTALNASLTDPLPAGAFSDLDWSISPAYAGPGSCGVTGAAGAQTLTCAFGDLPAGTTKASPSASITLVATTSPQDDCASLDNTATVSADNNPSRSASASIDLLCPALVIDKSADTEVVHFLFDVDGSVKSVDPANGEVTWTLTYTLTDGPVTHAVITDPLPDFLTFVSASDGGVFDAGVISWHFATLTESGTVSFVTRVSPDAPEPGPIVNVATIRSDETAPDNGTDSVRITSDQVEAATPTPSVPNTALALGQNGQPIQIPVELMVLLFIGSLGGLALANVKAARRRR